MMSILGFHTQCFQLSVCFENYNKSWKKGRMYNAIHSEIFKNTFMVKKKKQI